MPPTISTIKINTKNIFPFENMLELGVPLSSLYMWHPQERQNLDSSGISVPHFGHFLVILIPYLYSLTESIKFSISSTRFFTLS